MNRLEEKIKGNFIIFILEIYLIFTIIFSNSTIIDTTQFIIFSFLIFSSIVGFLGNKAIKIFITLFATFLYGSYIFYGVLLNNGQFVTNILDYIWLIMFPVLIFTTSKLGEIIEDVIKEIMQLRYRNNDLLRVDPITGFENKVVLFSELRDEMNKSRRHNLALTVMMIEVQYFQELNSIYSSKEVDSIFLSIAKIINDVARLEDMKYRITEDKFVLVLPFTGLDGAEIVKGRLKEKLAKIQIEKSSKQTRSLGITYKIGIKQYDNKQENPFELVKASEKELEYDV